MYKRQLQDLWQTAGVHTEIEMLENVKDKRDSGDFDVIFDGWQTVNAGDGQYYLCLLYTSSCNIFH